MEPIATYEELTNMDDATFVKAVKEKQLEQAKKLADDKAASLVNEAREKELFTFDEETRKQISDLEISRSLARTTIEKKYMEIITKEV